MGRLPCSLRFRLTLLVLSALVPALVMVIWTGLREYRNARTGVQEQATRMLRIAAAQYDQLFHDTRFFLEMLAQSPEIQDGDLPGIMKIFKSHADHYRRFENLGAVWPNGDLACSVLQPDAPVNYSDREWYLQVSSTKEFTASSCVQSRITGRSVIGIVYPVIGDEGQIRMILYATFDLMWLDRFAASANLPRGTSLNIFDRDRTVLARQPDSGQWVGKTLPDYDRITCVEESGEGVCESTGIDGLRRIYAVSHLSEVPKGSIYLSVGIPAEIPAADLRRMFYNVCCMALLGVVASAAAWFFGDFFIARHIRRIVSSAREITKGNLNTRIGGPYPSGELGELAGSFDVMGETLEQRERERKEAEDVLTEQKKQLCALTLKNQNLEEEERKKLSQELHDRVGQNLTGLSINLGIMKGLIPPDSMDEMKIRIDHARELVSDTMNCIRDVMSELQPPGLSDYGLSVALRLFCEKLAAGTGKVIKANCEESMLRPSRETEIALFRIAQEALCNAAGHSEADSIDVGLEVDERRLVLVIRDDGKGFSAETEGVSPSPGRFGLLGMRERAAGIGAKLSIESHPGKGTAVLVEIEV